MSYCTNCGGEEKPNDVFCSQCGTKKQHVREVVSPSNYENSLNIESGLGLSLSSLIVGIIALVIGFVDIGSVNDGTYAFLSNSEIGFLVILSFTALGLGIGASVKKNRFWIASLIVSVISVLTMFVCATHGTPF